MKISDIQTWRLPDWAEPYGRLARIDKPIGIWLLLLPGWWSILMASGGIGGLGLRGWGILVLFGIGAVAMRAAGCVVNDLWDRKLDAQVARTRNRPLASEEIKVWQAVLFLVLLLAVGLAILLQFNWLTVVLGCLTIPLIAAYPFMKRITWWPQAFLGVTFNFGALMGWSAVTGTIAVAPVLLYLGGIFWTLGYDTVYAHQDKDDDELVGIKSSALALGTRSKKGVAIFFAAAWILISCAALTGAPYSFAFMILLFGLLHMIWQVWVWKPDEAESSLKIFKSNRDFGLIVLLAFIFA